MDVEGVALDYCYDSLDVTIAYAGAGGGATDSPVNSQRKSADDHGVNVEHKNGGENACGVQGSEVENKNNRENPYDEHISDVEQNTGQENAYNEHISDVERKNVRENACGEQKPDVERKNDVDNPVESKSCCGVATFFWAVIRWLTTVWRRLLRCNIKRDNYTPSNSHYHNTHDGDDRTYSFDHCNDTQKPRRLTSTHKTAVACKACHLTEPATDCKHLGHHKPVVHNLEDSDHLHNVNNGNYSNVSYKSDYPLLGEAANTHASILGQLSTNAQDIECDEEGAVSREISNDFILRRPSTSTIRSKNEENLLNVINNTLFTDDIAEKQLNLSVEMFKSKLDDSDSDTLVGSIISVVDSSAEQDSLERCSSLRDFDRLVKRVSDIDFDAIRSCHSCRSGQVGEPRAILGSGGILMGSLKIIKEFFPSKGNRILQGPKQNMIQSLKSSSYRRNDFSRTSISSLFRITENPSNEVFDNCGEAAMLRPKNISADADVTSRKRLPSVIAPMEAMTAQMKPYSRSSFNFSAPAKPGELIVGMCRESQFYSHSFGDGVSETESEEDEEDTPTPTPTPVPPTQHVALTRTSRRRISSGDTNTENVDNFRTSRRRIGSDDATIENGDRKRAIRADSCASCDEEAGGRDLGQPSRPGSGDRSHVSGGSDSSTGQGSGARYDSCGHGGIDDVVKRRNGLRKDEVSRKDGRRKDEERCAGLPRTTSQFSDLDKDFCSKRNSQAASSEPSEGDDLSSLNNSDLESYLDAASPRSSLLQEQPFDGQRSGHYLTETADRGAPSRCKESGVGQHQSTEGAPRSDVSNNSDKPGYAGARSSQNNNRNNSRSYDISDDNHRKYISFDGPNISALPLSTTCPELYTQDSSQDGTDFSKTQRNLSDQNLHREDSQRGSENQHQQQPTTTSVADVTTSSDSLDIVQDNNQRNAVDTNTYDDRPPTVGGATEGGDADPQGDDDASQQESSQLDHRKTKAYRIALELLTTEETYVHVLHLIDQEFQFRVDQENRARPMFPADHVPQMFSNVKSIYKLHHDFLLPQLQERLLQWDSCPRIGDIMTKLAPFLKMYTEYVRNFDHAMTVINSSQAKCPQFASIMAQIHQLESCRSLTLQHHMLSPVQRIPRYEMLLRDYLRKLPQQHQDRHDTTKALHLVATAASHANEAMSKIDQFQKLLAVQENISGCVDLVSPTRELIKQGKIIKISARSGDHQERYLYLLSDLLLLCSPRLGGRVTPQYRLRARYNVENLHVVEGDNLETANTFYIRDASKTVELYTQTLEEKEAWLAGLFHAIEETYRRKSSLKLSQHFEAEDDYGSVCSGGAELGKEPPILVPLEGVAKCMRCTTHFSLVRRRHHCRACGSVVCNKCSSYKAALPCEAGRCVKVCRACYAKLNTSSSSMASSASLGASQTSLQGASCEEDAADGGGRGSASSSRLSSMDGSDLIFRTRGVLEVSAGATGAIMEGELQLKTHRKAWQVRWFALHQDFVLYSYRSNADTIALTATPLPGYTVALLQGSRSSDGVCDKDKGRAFKLHYSKKQYVFLAASKADCARWVVHLQRASRAEMSLPDEGQ